MVFWLKALRKVILHCFCCAQRAVLEEWELHKLCWFGFQKEQSGEQLSPDPAGFGGKSFLGTNAFLQVSQFPCCFLICHLTETEDFWEKKAKVREVEAFREMVLCFRLSGISGGWAAKAHEERETLDPKMPSHALKMGHRALSAGVCPGSFLGWRRLLCHWGALKWHTNR